MLRPSSGRFYIEAGFRNHRDQFDLITSQNGFAKFDLAGLLHL